MNAYVVGITCRFNSLSLLQLCFIYAFCAFVDGQPLLASGGSSGVISIWNLEKRRLQSVIKEAHDSPIISLHFFANEPVLMSSSADNSVKARIFFNFILYIFRFLFEVFMIFLAQYFLGVREI